MKNYIFISLIAIVSISCSDDRTAENELVGTWKYKREFYSANILSPTIDTIGTMIFEEDEKGLFFSATGFMTKFMIEWDFQSNDRKLAITKLNTLESLFYDKTKIYEIEKDGEDLITLSFPYSNPQADTLTYIESFEILKLTRQ